MAVGRTQVRRYARRVKVAADYERMARGRRKALDADLVLYESFAGNGMVCNPLAIFRELHAAADLSRLRHVWVLDDLQRFASTVERYADDPRVSFVEYGSNEYFMTLATAKYLVNNDTFPVQFGKRDGQVYLNTWHGTPLKAMGYDIPNGVLDSVPAARTFLAADYLLAPNDDTAQMYLSSFRMSNIFRGRMIAEGTPRVDVQFGPPASPRATLAAHGVTVDDEQQIVLYAPTWRGSPDAPTNDVRQLRGRIEAMAAQVDTQRYRLLLKVHPLVYKHAAKVPGLQAHLVPQDVATNEVLAATDILVTDYSSVLTDFLATGRPVLVFAPDLDAFESWPGLRITGDEWPGPVSRSVDELVTQLKRLGTGSDDDPAVTHAAAYAQARKRYCPREDGNAAARVVDIVFRGTSDGYDVRADFADGRTSLLIHLGGMLGNGITTSALNLLRNIDHDRFDVTATFSRTTSVDRLQRIALIDPRVRVLPRLGGVNGSKARVKPLLSLRNRSPRQQEAVLRRSRDLLTDEWMRCFGASRFDVAIDFSSYMPFWVQLLHSGSPGSLAIWLHNDMHAEATNEGRRRRLRASVSAVTGLLGIVDRAVSVSEALAEVNAEHLGHRASSEVFTFARNTIDYSRVLHLAYGITGHEEAAAAAGPAGSHMPGEAALHPDQLRESVELLLELHGINALRDEVQRRKTVSEVLPPARGVRTFVTVGRLSPEKNHERLIRAFDLVHQEDPDTRLVIMGSGASLPQLESLVAQLGLTAAVQLAGFQSNPYAVLANCDCFVLSSDYEGQPMVLLEAMILGLPIVTTAFGSVRSALPDGAGLIVERNVRALATGMRTFLRGDVPSKPFDPAAYNREAMQEFYRAVGVPATG